MNRSFDFYAALCGRLLVGGFFIWSGITNALNQETVSMTFTAAHIPDAPVAIFIAIAIEICAGVMLILGARMRMAAAILAAYLTIVTVLVHANFSSPAQTQIFLENLALVGGLLYMTAYGSKN